MSRKKGNIITLRISDLELMAIRDIIRSDSEENQSEFIRNAINKYIQEQIYILPGGNRKVVLTLPEEYLGIIDLLVDIKEYMSRSDAIHKYIKAGLEKEPSLKEIEHKKEEFLEIRGISSIKNQIEEKYNKR
jgi:Arc/MetJ-type ribon-helix-helix transcriptional regulator